MTEGTIKSVLLDKGFMFIAVPNRGDAFCHMSDIDPGLEWNDQLTERRVEFDLIETPRGLKAKNVRPAS